MPLRWGQIGAHLLDFSPCECCGETLSARVKNRGGEWGLAFSILEPADSERAFMPR